MRCVRDRQVNGPGWSGEVIGGAIGQAIACENAKTKVIWGRHAVVPSGQVKQYAK